VMQAKDARARKPARLVGEDGGGCHGSYGRRRSAFVQLCASIWKRLKIIRCKALTVLNWCFTVKVSSISMTCTKSIGTTRELVDDGHWRVSLGRRLQRHLFVRISASGHSKGGVCMCMTGRAPLHIYEPHDCSGTIMPWLTCAEIAR